MKNQHLAAECTAFCDKFPRQTSLAEDIYWASWSGKHWGRDGAIALSESMHSAIGGANELTQVLSAHYAAFGHAAKQLMKERFWYALKAISSLHDMLDHAKFLNHLHETKPLSLANLQVLIAVYNAAGKTFKKFGWSEKSDDYFRKAYPLAEPSLNNRQMLNVSDSRILLYADMLSNPLITSDQRKFLEAACKLYVNVQGSSFTVKIRCLRAIGEGEEAKKLSEELGLADQILKST